MADTEETDRDVLLRIARELKTIREGFGKILFAISDGESEVPEKIRRFTMHMHAMHDIRNMYVEQGHEPPPYLNREVERLDDRCRQLLEELNTDGGAFEKVRAEMAKDTKNRWDHTRQLAPPGETK